MPSAGTSSLLLALILGLFKLVGGWTAGLLDVLLHDDVRSPHAAGCPSVRRAESLAKKAEDLRNQGKKLLSSYGWVNPATKSKRANPDRTCHGAGRGRGGSAPGSRRCRGSHGRARYSRDDHNGRGRETRGTPGPAVTSAPAVAATPVPAAAPSAPAGMPPEQIYRLVCMACHDTDGKGKIVRLAMPSIPDLTDAKWQASRKDSELQHSILEGKDSIINGVKLPLMLPMKDKLALDPYRREGHGRLHAGLQGREAGRLRDARRSARCWRAGSGCPGTSTRGPHHSGDTGRPQLSHQFLQLQPPRPAQRQRLPRLIDSPGPLRNSRLPPRARRQPLRQ